MNGENGNGERAEGRGQRTEVGTSLPRMLPCPFCGGEAVVLKNHKRKRFLRPGWFVGCANPGQCKIFATTLAFETPVEAIQAWNIRA